MNWLWQDLRYGARMLWKHPGFTLVAVLTLALGIGANTAVFSVVNAFLLRPLPYREPERLVILQRTPAVTARSRTVYSYPVFNEVREQAQSFDGVAAFAFQQLTLDGADGPETLLGARVTSNFFAVFGVAPLRGRAFSPGEDEPNQPRRVILSHGLWQRRFGGDANIIGRTVAVDKDTLEVVGVMPPDFKFDLIPNLPKLEFLSPLNPSPAQMTAGNTSWLSLIARLKPAVTLTQAQTELGVIAERIKRNTGQSTRNNDIALSAVTVKEFFVGDAQTPLLLLLGAVGFVLLIACVNVANLLLARGAGRQKEIAIRSVLGASSRRLMSQMLTESLLLSLGGGLLGWLLVHWLLQAIVRLTPSWMMRMEEISLDRKVFLFTLAVSLGTGLLFGLLPALSAAKVDLQAALKSTGVTAGGSWRGFRHLLVIAEVALAVVLLVGAGLMLNSFVRLTNVAVGFDAENVLSLRINPLSRTQPAEHAAFTEAVLQRVQTLPGVKAAALIDSLPVAGGSSQSDKRSALLEGPLTGDSEAEITVEYHWATPEYFQAMGMRLLKGRLFSAADTVGAKPVVVVSERLAQQAWPGEEPLGKRLLLGKTAAQHPTVIGVVSDVRRYGQEPAPNFYAPFGQNFASINHAASLRQMVIRTATDPLQMMAAVRAEILAVDRRVVIDNVTTLDQQLGNVVAQPRFYAVLLGGFALLGLLLAVIGLYGVLSYTVSRMTREVGIRLALGAERRDILKLIIGHGLVLTGIGLALGLAGAAALSRLLGSLLHGVKPTDPVTYAAVSLFLLLTALLACYLPARRATRIDPMVALRCE